MRSGKNGGAFGLNPFAELDRTGRIAPAEQVRQCRLALDQ